MFSSMVNESVNCDGSEGTNEVMEGEGRDGSGVILLVVTGQLFDDPISNPLTVTARVVASEYV